MRTGTEYIYAESDWHSYLSDAENEVISRIEDMKSDIESYLESEGKEIIGIVDYTPQNDSMETEEGLKFQSSQEAEINWKTVDDKQLKGFKNIKRQNPTVISDIEDSLKKQIAKSGTRYDRLSLSNLYISESNVLISDVAQELESSYSSQSFIIINNLPSKIKKKFKIELTESLGDTIQLKKHAKYTTSTGVGLKFKAVSADLKTQHELSTTQTTTQNFTTIQKFTDDFEIEIPPMKKYIIKVSKKINNSVRKVEGHIKVNGDAKFGKSNYRCRGDWPTTRCGDEWSYWTKKINDVINQEKIYINGLIKSSIWDIDYEVSYDSQDIPFEPSLTETEVPLINIFKDTPKEIILALQENNNVLELSKEQLINLEANKLINWRESIE